MHRTPAQRAARNAALAEPTTAEALKPEAARETLLVDPAVFFADPNGALVWTAEMSDLGILAADPCPALIRIKGFPPDGSTDFRKLGYDEQGTCHYRNGFGATIKLWND